MKILHLCLACFYIDRQSYQENILPRMHKRMGHDVKIIASTETYIDDKKLGYIEASEYINEDGIPVKRIPYMKCIPSKIAHKLRIYSSLYQSLSDFSPNFIFVHDVQFLSIISLKKYLIKNSGIKVVVDGHTDFLNSAKNFFSYRVLHGIVYRACAQTIEPFVSHFFGTLPAREDFFVNVYNIPSSKVSLLPMGIDDKILRKINLLNLGSNIRSKFAIGNKDFMIVTGGKINDNRPETLLLMETVAEINRSDIILLFFGNVSNKYSVRFRRLCASPQIIDLGWQSTIKTCEIMAAGDLVVFPGLHSVMWEQAVALGRPCIFRKMDGFDHVDIGGNAIFIDNISVKSLKKEIISLANKDCLKYQNMLKAANNSKKDIFLYSKIAEKSINICFGNNEKVR